MFYYNTYSYLGLHKLIDPSGLKHYILTNDVTNNEVYVTEALKMHLAHW